MTLISDDNNTFVSLIECISTENRNTTIEPNKTEKTPGERIRRKWKHKLQFFLSNSQYHPVENNTSNHKKIGTMTNWRWRNYACVNMNFRSKLNKFKCA